MHRVNAGAKSAWNNDAVIDKLNRGADGIEIQVLSTRDRFFTDSWTLDLTKPCLEAVTAVHMPLTDNIDIAIDTRQGPEYLKETCARAQALSETYGHRIHVIAHYNGSKKYLEDIGYYSQFVDFIRGTAKIYDNVDLCIENNVCNPMSPCENCILVIDVGRENVRTCFDTCHALMIEKVTGAMAQVGNYKPFTIMDQITANRGLCSHIHFANAEWYMNKYGYKKGHGTTFGEKDDFVLAYLVQKSEKYFPDADVIYEVREDDYYNSMNYSKIKEQRENLLSAL